MVWILVGAAIAVGGIPLLPPLRRKRVMRDAEKIARSVSYADSSADWPALYARVRARYVGGQVGNVVGLAAVWGLVGAAPGELSLVTLMVIGASAGTTIGTWVGHLWGARVRSAGPRLVSMRERRSEDYLTPWELTVVRSCALVPLAGLAVGLGVAMSGASSRDMTGFGLAATSFAALGLGVGSRELARRTLRAPADMTTPGGLAWAEILRAVMLRDVNAGLWAVATLVVGMATFIMLTTLDGEPPWVTPAGVGVIVAASLVNLGLVWWSIRDRDHQWALEHAASGVA